MRLVVFELCGSETKFSYRFKSLLVFIWITTGRKAIYKLLQQEQVIWKLIRKHKVFTVIILSWDINNQNMWQAADVHL